MTSQFSTYVIAEPCVGVKDATCLEVCPVDCIATTPGSDQFYIDPSVCIACEQCALVCPVEAIFLDVQVPPQWQSYMAKNAGFFQTMKGDSMPVPVKKAMQIIEAGHAKAAELDIPVSVAVVDEGGRLIAFGRMDQARPMSVEIAINKAYTAATFQTSTSQLASQAGQSWFQSMIVSTQGRVMALAGGIPVIDAHNAVGAVGVSGGTEQQDEECCKAAVDVV